MSEIASVPSTPQRPTRSRAFTREVWLDRLARFALSGLTPAQFCATEALSLPSFYAWKRRIAAEDHLHETAAPHDPGPRLLPVHFQPAAAAVELVLPGGAVLRL